MAKVNSAKPPEELRKVSSFLSSSPSRSGVKYVEISAVDVQCDLPAVSTANSGEPTAPNTAFPGDEINSLIRENIPSDMPSKITASSTVLPIQRNQVTFGSHPTASEAGFLVDQGRVPVPTRTRSEQDEYMSRLYSKGRKVKPVVTTLIVVAAPAAALHGRMRGGPSMLTRGGKQTQHTGASVSNLASSGYSVDDRLQHMYSLLHHGKQRDRQQVQQQANTQRALWLMAQERRPCRHHCWAFRTRQLLCPMSLQLLPLLLLPAPVIATATSAQPEQP